MKKRILSLLLVVAMLATMVVMPVYAAETESTNASSSAVELAKTVCPCCGLAYDQIEWTEISDTTEANISTYAIESAGHYRLVTNLYGGNSVKLAKALKDTNVDKIVFDLYGKKISGSFRGFYDEGDYSTSNAIDKLYVVDSVGSGEVIATASAAMGGTMVYSQNVDVEIYGGSWTTATKAGESGSLGGTGRALRINGGSISFYGGSFDFSQESLTSTKGFVTTYYGSSSNNAATVNVYGGTFIGGDSDVGDFYINSASTLNIYGGNIQGTVNGMSGAVINISGDAKVSNVDTTTCGTVNLGELTEGASIKVTAAQDTAFTPAFSSKEIAEVYLKYVGSAANNYQSAYVTDTNALALDEAVCPHCNVAYSEIKWAEWNFDLADASKWGATDETTGEATNYVVSGHYYLTADLENEGQYYIGATESDDEAAIAAGTMPQLDVCLDTRGYDITSTKRVFYVYEPHKLAICDSVGGTTITGAQTTTAGTIYNGGSTVLKIFDCELSCNPAATRTAQGGVLSCGSASEVLLKNCTVNGTSANNGGAIAGGSANVTIEDSVINGGTASGAGGAIYMTTGTLTLKNSTVNGGSAKNGGAIYGAGTNISVTDGSVINGGNSTSTGGAIWYNNENGLDVAFNVEDSTIIGDTSSSNGGVMYLYKKAVVNIKNSTVTGGESGAYGGVAFVYSTATITVENSTVYSGTADPHPSTGYSTDGIYGGGTMIITNSKVEDISPSSDDGVTFTGKVEGHLHLCAASLVDISGMTGGDVAVTGGLGAFTAALESDTAASAYLPYFSSADSSLSVKVQDAALVLAAGAITRYCPHCEQTLEFTAYTYDGTVDILEGGHYYLFESNTTATSEVGVGNESVEIDVIIDLNGNSIENKFRAFTVRSGSELYLFDSVGGSQVVGGHNKAGACIYGNANSKITLHGGTYTQYPDRTYTQNGGVIYGSNTELNIIGDAVVTGGTTSGNGGNIYATKGTLTIADNAVISDGTANSGGNIYAVSGCVLTMTSGTVSGGRAIIVEDTAYGRGGNIYMSSTTHTISGGTITGGVSESDIEERGGGNIYIYDTGVLDLNGGVISDGSCATNGGNIYVGGTLNLNGGSFSGGDAGSYGADIYVYEKGTLKVAETATGELGMGFAASLLGAPIYGNDIANTTAPETMAVTMVLDGDMGNAPIIAQDGALFVKGGGAAIEALNGEITHYPNAADAVAAFNENDHSHIIVCGDQTLVLGAANYAIDLKSSDVVLNGEKGTTVTCFDSANEDYATYGTLTLDENVSLNNTDKLADAEYDYITLEDNGVYSFHILDMKITAVSLKTKTGGLYYEAKYYCDSTLADQVETFGIVTQLNSMPTDFGSTTLYSEISGENFVTKTAITGATMNGIIGDNEITDSDGNVISNSDRGQMKVYAAPYVIFKTGTTVIGIDEVGMSLKDCCDTIDAMITELNAGDTDDQATAANYIAYMTNLMNNVWGAYGLDWTFVNFPATTEA